VNLLSTVADENTSSTHCRVAATVMYYEPSQGFLGTILIPEQQRQLSANWDGRYVSRICPAEKEASGREFDARARL
jgi:hypothetical protein